MFDLDSPLPPQAGPADAAAPPADVASGETDAAMPPPSLCTERRASPGIVESLLLSFLFYVLVTAAGVLFFVFRLRLEWFSSFLLQLVIAWPLILWVGLRRSRVSFREAMPLARFPVRSIPALLVASYGATILLIHAASSVEVPRMLRQTLAQGVAPQYWMPCFLAAVVVAPVAEELFFRGLVLRAFVARYSSFHAVWMSALLFALFHLNLWQGILALPLGFVYAWLALRTGSVLPGIISHAVVNFSTNFLMVPLMHVLGYDAAAREALGGRYPGEMVILGAALAIVGGLMAWRQLAVPPSKETSAVPDGCLS
ncbi:MAG: CPBP family intramembrane glutamic endopeptidase [Prosthecobacter sp.]